MVLLGTLFDTGERKAFTPKAMYEWYEACRNSVTDPLGFPGVEPLNHAWALPQGFRRCIPRPTSCPHCHLNPLKRSKWLREEAIFVCLAC
jgi:hypothetical protein